MSGAFFIRRRHMRKGYDLDEILSECLYHAIGAVPDADGWFSIDAVLQVIEAVCPTDRSELIAHISDKYRYILNDDKTKIRISPEFLIPSDVESQLIDLRKIDIKDSVFKKNDLSYLADIDKKIIVERNDGKIWEFPFYTNTVHYIDDMRFFMVLEKHGKRMLAVSSYMTKSYKNRYRMFISGFPKVIDNEYPIDAELVDFDGYSYKIMVTSE